MLPKFNDTAAIVRLFIQASRIQDVKDASERKSQVAQRLTLEASMLLAGQPSSFKKAVTLAIDAAELDQSSHIDQVLRKCLHLLPRLVCGLQHPSLIHRVAFSDDGRFVATETGPKLSAERQQHMWEVDGRCRVHGDAQAILGPGRLASADGKLRADVDGETRTVRVRLTADATDWLTVPVSQGFDAHRDCLRFTPDGRTLIVADATRVTIWALDTRELASEIFLPCSAIAVSQDGSTLALATGSSVELRSLATGHPIRRIEQSSSIEMLEFDPSGTRLAVGCTNGCVRLWTTDGVEISRMVHRLPVRNLAFSRDGRRLATSVASMFDFDDMLRIWEVEAGRHLDGAVVATARECRFDARGERAVLASDAQVTVWSLATTRHVTSLRLRDVTNASFVGDHHLATLQPSALSLWDLSTGERVWQLADVEAYDCGPTHVAVKLENGALEIRRIADAVLTGRLKWTLTDAADSIHRGFGPFKLSADSTALAFVTHTPHRLRVIDLATAKLRLELDSEPLIDQIVWSRNGRRFAASSPSRFAFKLLKAFSVGLTHEHPHNERPCILVHDEDSGATRNIATEGFCNSLEFSEDGERLLGGLTEGIASIWDVNTQQRVIRVVHGDEVWAARFGLSGRVFVTGASDGVARIWNSVTGEEIRRIRVGTDVTKVALGSAEDYLFTFDASGDLRRWMLSTSLVVAEVRRLVSELAEASDNDVTIARQPSSFPGEPA